MPKAAKNRSAKARSPAEHVALLDTLKARFQKHTRRHQGIEWSTVRAKLEAAPEKLRSLFQMEQTGGEPDIIGCDENSGEFIFADCSPESPVGRRSVCYDRAGLESRKEHKPKSSAMDMATDMGARLLTEDEYLELQKLGEFDLKTSSWVATPAEIRELGGALYCERRYNRIFTGHNGAQSYYAVRGFRTSLRV
jgi:hypothetical protein